MRVDATGMNRVNLALLLFAMPAVTVQRSEVPDAEDASVTSAQVIAPALLVSVNVQYGSALSSVMFASASAGGMEKSPLATDVCSSLKRAGPASSEASPVLSPLSSVAPSSLMMPPPKSASCC